MVLVEKPMDKSNHGAVPSHLLSGYLDEHDLGLPPERMGHTVFLTVRFPDVFHRL
jgi:hypothetical protein